MGERNDVLGFFGAPIEKDLRPSEPPPAEPDDAPAATLPAGPLPDVEKERSNFEEAIKKNPRLRPFVENALYHLRAAHQAAAESLALAENESFSEEDRAKRTRILENKRRENFSQYAQALKDLGLHPSIGSRETATDDSPSLVEIHRRYIGEIRAKAARRKVADGQAEAGEATQK